jgi:NhaP-type Na+/H+ or K+/H+ antiporter
VADPLSDALATLCRPAWPDAVELVTLCRSGRIRPGNGRLRVHGLEVVVLIGLAVLVLSVLAQRLRVAPPLVLLLGGVAIGFVPKLGDLSLPPDVVLFLFLPALLYWESLNTSLREIRANLRVIVLQSVVLVIATAAAAAAVGHAWGLSWPMAFVLGAVVAPTDAPPSPPWLGTSRGDR